MNEEYIKLTQEWHRKGFESRQAEVDELQKRIDEALEFSENIHDENAIDKLYTIIDILKGATP